MNDGEVLSWTALEYEERERSRDWFWALGVIVFTACATALIFGNYFFAALIVISGGLLGFFAIKKPELISYELNNKGLRIESRLYPYENIRSFWVQAEEDKHGSDEKILKPVFFVKSERFFMPILSIPIDETLAENIREVMLSKNVEEEEMREHISDKIMEVLGF